MKSMFELLMSLPIFHGISQEKIPEVLGNTKFHFFRFKKGETIITAGEPCTHIKFIISGAVKSSIESSDGSFSVTQSLDAPNVLNPDFLFGRSTLYPCTVVVTKNVGVLQISKAEYMTLLSSSKIFMFNALNMLSSDAQKAFDGAICENSIEKQLAFKTIALTQHRGYDISLKSNNPAAVFGVTERQLSIALEELKQRGIVDFSPTEIKIHSRAELVAILTSR